jgi:predicted SAM-dependent methyltransferase
MPVLELDAARARKVLTTRKASALDLRVVLAFKNPRDADRLAGEGFDEVFGDGRTSREQVRAKIAELTAEGALRPLPDGAAEGVYASELASLGHLLDGLAGDLAAMDEWAEREVEINGRSPAAVLAAARRDLTALRESLRAARPRYVAEQVAGAPTAGLRLHLGCGASRAEGWLNIDIAGGDARLNLCWELPFADGSADSVYSAHTLEHLDFHTAAPRLLREIHRVLAPGGVVRLAVPDLGALARAYAAGDAGFFREYDRARPEFAGAAGYRTDLAKVMRMAGSAVKSGWFFEHKMGYDFETLADLLRSAGFPAESVTRARYGESDHEALRPMDSLSGPAGLSYEDTANTLFVEAVKPAEEIAR